MKNEEILKRMDALEMRVAALEGRQPATSRTNCQEECGIQSRVKEERTLLPERAWELLERARDGGLLGEDWRPIVSLTDAALMVNYIRQEVDVPWGAFEQMWGVKDLRIYYDKCTYLKSFDERSERVLNVLGLGKCLGSFLTDDRQSREMGLMGFMGRHNVTGSVTAMLPVWVGKKQ